MPDPAALLSALAILLLVAVLGWFTFGTQQNIRRGNQTLAWLQDGLRVLGPRATLRWLGSSVAALRIVDPSAPFREAEVMVVLEPRDLGALWALARSRGRRDFLLVRLSLVRAPRFRAELLDQQAWNPFSHRADDDGFERVAQETTDGGQAIEVRDDGSAPIGELRRSWRTLTDASQGVWRMAVAPTVPHIELHVLPPPPGGVGSARLFSAIRELALLLSGERTS
ncbi:MAG TPA: hypothetical protein VKU35_00810 [Candidatus Limnocylindria bacterium]|nr:hypothetical protein [Candidatus Limnocylindria bacterium]